MSITPVHSNSSAIFSPLGDNNALKMLENQKQRLHEQIQKVNESKMDDKTKQEKVKQLQEQIYQIDAEIQQRQREKLSQSTNQQPAEGQAAIYNHTATTNNSNQDCMATLVQASATYSQAKIMSGTKDELNSKGKVLKMEIKLDGARGVETKAKWEELHKIESKKQFLDKKVGETIEKAQNQMKEPSEKAVENPKNESASAASGSNYPRTQEDNLPEDAGERAPSAQEVQEAPGYYRRVDIKV